MVGVACLSSRGAVLRVVGEGQGHRRASSELRRSGKPRSDGGVAVVVGLAHAELDAVVVRRQVGLLDPVDKGFDPYNVAEEVARTAEL